MTDVETWEPQTTGGAVEILDRARQLLAQAQETDDVALIRDQAEAMREYARRRDMGREAEMAASEIVRRAERRLGELYLEMKDAGQVRGRGRPKANTTSDVEYADWQAVFGNANERSEAVYMAGYDEDTFNEAIATARESGKLTRRAIVAALPGVAPKRGGAAPGASADDGETFPLARVMAKALRVLAAVAEELGKFDPSEIDSPDRKEWAAGLREHCATIDAWRKLIPR